MKLQMNINKMQKRIWKLTQFKKQHKQKLKHTTIKE